MSPAVERKLRRWIVDLLPYLAVLNLVLILILIPVATVAAVTAIRTKHNAERIAVTAGGTQRNTKRLERLERNDHAAAMGSCIRLKIQRTQNNKIALIVWQVFSAAAVRERKLAQQPGPQQATHERSATSTSEIARKLRWTPQTDCKRAVDDPSHYRPPHPVPFTPGQKTVP